MAWVNEATLNWTPAGGEQLVFFSPIVDISGEQNVYLTDQDVVFKKYNIDTNIYTTLANLNYSSVGVTGTNPLRFNRTLAVSPDGTKIACLSDGQMYPGTALQRTGGGRRVEIYNIAGNSWAASKQTDFLINTYTTYGRALVWVDEDTLWVWCVEGYSSASQVNVWLFAGKCVKYTISTDTWTPYTNTFWILGRADTAPYEWFGYASPTAIKADGSVVWLGAAGSTTTSGGASTYSSYTVATDAYAGTTLNIDPSTSIFCHTYDRDKLWFFRVLTTCRQGYVLISDGSLNYDAVEENTSRDTGYGRLFGVSDALTYFIARARLNAPQLMSTPATPITFIPKVFII